MKLSVKCRSGVSLSLFLTGGNRMRVRLQRGKVTAGQRWAILAAALLADLDAEDFVL